MMQLLGIIVFSYIFTLLVVGSMVTVGVDVNSIDGQDAYLIVSQTVLILFVLTKIRRFIYGRR